MNLNTVANIILPIFIFVFILYRQLRERPVNEKNPYRIMIIFAIIGIVETSQYIGAKPINGLAFIILALSLIVGAGFGLLRGRLTHLWRDNGVLVQKGNWIVVVLWLIGLGLHLSIDLLINKVDVSADQLGSVSTLIYMAITLGAQRFMILQRAESVLEKEEFLAQKQSRKKS